MRAPIGRQRWSRAKKKSWSPESFMGACRRSTVSTPSFRRLASDDLKSSVARLGAKSAGRFGEGRCGRAG